MSTWAVLAASAAGASVASCWPHAAPLTARLTAGGRRWPGVASAVVVPVAAVLAAVGLVAPEEGFALVAAWLPVIALAGVAAGAVTVLRRRAVQRRVAAVQAQAVLDFCEEIAGELDVGSSPALALERASRRWPFLAPVASAQRLGAPVPEALRTLSRAPGCGDLVLVAAAWQVSERTGAVLARALTAVASALREDQKVRRVVASELASARATARLMAVLPLLTLAVGSGAGDPVAFLLRTPPGLACAGAGLLLALAGVAWIEAIAASVERTQQVPAR